MASGFFIKNAFMDWDDNPVITTMDSIAAPIKNIQRPTVTVCPDEDTPPDNWAPIEVIANYLSFACTNSEYQAYIPGVDLLPLCNSTKHIRKDFEYVIKAITRDMTKWMVDPALQVSHEEVRGDSSMNELIWKVAEAITDGKVDRHLVENLPSDYFGIDANIKSILKSLINETDVDYSFFYNYYYNNYNEDKANCTSNECLATLKQFYGIVEAMYEANPSPNLPFGSLLSWFLPQEYEQFSNDVKILGMNSLDVDSYFIEQKQAYLNAHNLFTELTKYYGFKANESISLFDIPAIMSENKEKEKVRASNSYAFYMTQNNITQAELSRCYNVWNAYSVDQTSKKHPCEEDCCNKGPKSMGNNLEAIMRVMRIARGRGKARFNLTEILQNVINDEEMRYPIRFRKEDLDEHESIKDANAVIPFCELSDATNNEKTEDGNVITHEPECHLFKRSLSEQRFKN